MPTINNEIVISSGYVTYRNARPQLLSNGWIVVAVYSAASSRLQFRVKKTPTGAWEDLAFLTTSNVLSWSMVRKGNRIYCMLHTSSSSATSFLNFDATSVSSSVTLTATSIDNTSSSGAFNGEDMAINSTGTELFYIFSAKTPSAPNTFNVRIVKGIINADGSVVWGTVENLTSTISFSVAYSGVSVVYDAQDSPVLAYATQASDPSNNITVLRWSGGGWVSNNFYNPGSAHFQDAMSLVFIPQSINGLASGRIWLAWHGVDATDSVKNNIRTSYSDDGGATWATATKHTSGNVYNQTSPSLTASNDGKVLLYWDGEENPAGTTITTTREKVYSGTWGATSTITGDDHFKVSALFDNKFRLKMTRSPIVRTYSSGVRYNGTYFAGASVSPISGDAGDKASPTVVLAYTVTPEDSSTITSIVEKINGTTVNTYSNPASLSRTFMIPQLTWDALKYYNTHTINVMVTDSKGTVNTQTYTFTKTLANDASLLEGAKAAKDGKDRISTKRDGIAGQVGLPAGSTFDAISAQLASGNAFKKFQPGVSTSNANGDIVVTSLSFKPTLVFVYTNNPLSDYRDTALLTSLVSATNNVYINNSNQALSYTLASLTDTGFKIRAQNPNSSYNWIAIS